jgi:membrane protease YdiL (CAAX protease family)
LLAIVLAEVTTMFLLPQAGLALYGALLLVLLWQASSAQQIREQRFLLTLALAPLIRLVGLSLPLASVPVIFWYIAIGVPLFIASILAARVSKMSRGMLGLNGRKLLFQIVIGLSGIVLGYIEYLTFKPIPLVSEFRWGQLWMPVLILILFSGLLEEFIFRGVMQTAAVQFLGRRGILYISLIFSVLHLGIKSTPDFLLAFAVGLFYGFIVLRTGSILGVALSHSLMNILVYLIFPFVLSSPNVQVYFLQHVIQPLSGILTSAWASLIVPIF